MIGSFVHAQIGDLLMSSNEIRWTRYASRYDGGATNRKWGDKYDEATKAVAYALANGDADLASAIDALAASL